MVHMEHIIILGPGPGALCVAEKMLDGVIATVSANKLIAARLRSHGMASETGENVLANNPTPPAI